MKKKTLFITSALLLILPVIYMIRVYPALPQIIPTHFGLDGKPNNFGQKSTLAWTIAGMTVIGIFCFLVFLFMPQIDPKLRGKPDTGQYLKISFLVACLLSGIQIWLIYGTVNAQLALGKIVGAVTGIGICIIGNFMYNIKPNYFFGIRVPWTLDSEDNWRATHHLAGKLWFFGGLAIAACSLLFPSLFQRGMLVVLLLLLAFIPMTYSFLYFRKHVSK